ncbi:MAG: choice-of-anchor tandem repeat GloVer-containing protein [Terriglobales bacterium]
MLNPRISNLAARLLASVIALIVLATPALAQHKRAFMFSGANGWAPEGGLTFNGSSSFYGTTFKGGSANLGVVYEIGPGSNGGAAETVLYSFTGSPDGANPIGDLALDDAGNLYGATENGGLNNEGMVFELSPPSSPGGAWVETVLYSFNPANNLSDADPQTGLVLDSAGNLYGTAIAEQGGAACSDEGVPFCGEVFELSPPTQPGGAWIQTVLHLFTTLTGSDGAFPAAPVTFDQAGNLLGTTSRGGTLGGGTVFKLTPPSVPGAPWTFTVLVSFDGVDGAYPQAGLTESPGGDSFFGTTPDGGTFGGGTVFEILPPASPGGPWKLEVAHAFGARGDGDSPTGRLTLGSGALYGTTCSGGAKVTSAGTVFQISESAGKAVETILYSFTNGNDGNCPGAGVILLNGALYGTTIGGGYDLEGTVFQLSY